VVGSDTARPAVPTVEVSDPATKGAVH
jgi:hypothetical protein